MRPYSIDLRERIVKMYTTTKLSLLLVANLFNVSVSSVKRFVKQNRETGSLSPKELNNGSSPKIDKDNVNFLKDILKDKLDLSQNELQERLLLEKGIEVSQPTISRTLKRAGITLKKKQKEQKSKSAKISKRHVNNLKMK